MNQPSQEASQNQNPLKAPKAAAIAGILFSVLLGISLVIILASLPHDLRAGGTWLSSRGNDIILALNLIPFAGIAFLWFMGVLNDRTADRRDRFLLTVSLGSGLLFLALLFLFSAVSGSSIGLYVSQSDPRLAEGIYAFGSTVAREIMNIYDVRMAGVFMISTSSLFMRTQVIPRPLVWLGIAFAILMLLRIGAIDRLGWVILLFPLWVLLISIYILMDNYRRNSRSQS